MSKSPCLCGRCARERQAARDRDYETMLDTLTRAQARCTELLQENRWLRRELELMQVQRATDAERIAEQFRRELDARQHAALELAAGPDGPRLLPGASGR